jgi:hypothetical protein
MQMTFPACFSGDACPAIVAIVLLNPNMMSTEFQKKRIKKLLSLAFKKWKEWERANQIEDELMMQPFGSSQWQVSRWFLLVVFGEGN